MAFKRRERKLVEIENAEFIFRTNFEGRGDKYNREGDRFFDVILPQDMAEQMAEDGWNVKIYMPKGEDGKPDPNEPPIHHMKVKVRYSNFPPKIYTIGSRTGTKTLLDESNVGLLDSSNISHVDLLISPYEWENERGSGIAAYLDTMYATIEEDPFASKYAGGGPEDPDIF